MSANHSYFLDLPAELRCMIYSCISFPSIHHTLLRSDVKMGSEAWPSPPFGAPESSITIILPDISIAIMLVCRLITKEAYPILLSKIQRLREQPIRYVADLCAVRAMFSYSGPTALCVGFGRWRLKQTSGGKGGAFGKLCFSHLVVDRDQATERVRDISLTVPHVRGLTYGPEVLALKQPHLRDPRNKRVERVEISYVTPLPDFLLARERDVRSGVEFERGLIKGPTSGEEEGGPAYADMRPMSEEDFAKHVAALEVT
jgi:hypothetical protein